MLFSSAIVPLAGLVLPVMATDIANLVARQTDAADRVDAVHVHERSPAATEAPKPRWGMMELLDKRAVGTDTCGYISGDPTYYPLTCGGTGYTCTNSGSFRGCCKSSLCSSSTEYYTTCLDSTAKACSGSSVGPNTLCCNYNTLYPFCITYLWSTTASPGKLYTEFNCDRSVNSGQYILAADTSTSTSLSLTSSISTASITPTNPSVVTATSAGSSSTSTSTGTGIDSGGSSTNVGAIVGGVVGGIGGLALLGGLGFLIFWMNRRKKAVAGTTPAPPPAGASMAQAGPGPYQPGPGAPGAAGAAAVAGAPNESYNPHYSYAPTVTPTTPGGVGYPSPMGTPQPNYNQPGAAYMQPQHTGSTQPGASYMQPQHTGSTQPGAAYMQPQQTGSTFDPSSMGATTATPPVAGRDVSAVGSGSPTVAEAPAQNPVGVGANRAELA